MGRKMPADNNAGGKQFRVEHLNTISLTTKILSICLSVSRKVDY